MVTMLNEHSDLWDAADVQEMGLAKGKDDNDDELEKPEFIEDSDDEGKADDIDSILSEDSNVVRILCKYISEHP